MNQVLLTASYVFILFASNILGSVGGFGAGMISIPFLIQLFDAKSVIMASTMTCILNVFIVLKNWKYIDNKKFLRVLLYMCIGLPFGVYGLKMINVNVLKHILGGFMVIIGGYGILKLWIPRSGRFRLPVWALRGCLVAGGMVQGAISSGGSLVLLYAQQELEEKREFRATMALLWTIVSLLTVAQYMVIGALSREALSMFVLGLVPVSAGIYIGGKLCSRLSQRTFSYVINLVILLGGGMSLVR